MSRFIVQRLKKSMQFQIFSKLSNKMNEELVGWCSRRVVIGAVVGGAVGARCWRGLYDQKVPRKRNKAVVTGRKEMAVVREKQR